MSDAIEMPGAQRRGPIVEGLLVVAVALLVYANALGNDFTLDDRGVIVRNALVHDLSGVWRAFAHTYWPEETRAGQYRPLVVAGYALDWALSGGRAWWFHLGNLLWHAAASWLVWRLLRDLLPPLAALAGALVFAVHPVHVEAVANVVGRAELEMTCFALAALLLHRRGSPWALCGFALALLSKENGIVVPGLAVALDLLFGEGDARRRLAPRARLYAGYAVLAAAYLVLLAVLFRGNRLVVPASTWVGASTADRLLTMAAVVPEYVRLLLVPASLSIDYTPSVIDLATRLTPAGALGLVLLAGTAAAVAVSWRRAPAVALAIVWFAVAVSPVANVLFPSGVVLAERTLYLPSVSVALLGGATVAWLAAEGRARLAWTLAGAVVLLFALRAWTRTPTWRDNKTLMLTILDEHPESYRAHEFAASVYAGMRDWTSADRELTIARRIFQRDGELYHNAAGAALYLNDLPRARALLDTSLALLPDYALAHLRRAEVRYRLGDFAGAADGGMRSLALMPDSVRAAHVVAAAARRLGDPALAIRAYRAAIPRAPRDPDLHLGLSAALEAAGDVVAGRAEADTARRLRAGGGTRSRGPD